MTPPLSSLAPTSFYSSSSVKKNDDIHTVDEGQEDDYVQESTQHTASTSRRRRPSHSSTRILLFAFVLLVCGLAALQWFNVYEFLPALQKNKLDAKSTSESVRYFEFEHDYFAPTINFQSTSSTPRQQNAQYQEDLKLMLHSCKEPVRELEWEYYTPPTTATVSRGPSTDINTNSTTHKRLLIALYSGFDEYAHFLDHSAKIAKLYAKLWGPHVTVLVLQGTAFAPGGCQPPGIHTTLNKIRLLFHAIDHTNGKESDSSRAKLDEGGERQHQSYDQLLLLDADTLLVNMTVDVTTLLPARNNKRMLVTGPIEHHHDHKKKKETIPTGVTLWNLHHPDVRTVALDWFERSIHAVKKGTYQGDQDHLRISSSLYVEKEEFSTRGAVVRHYKQRKSGNLQERQRGLSRQADKICESYPGMCPDLEKTYESTNR